MKICAPHFTCQLQAVVKHSLGASQNQAPNHAHKQEGPHEGLRATQTASWTGWAGPPGGSFKHSHLSGVYWEEEKPSFINPF